MLTAKNIWYGKGVKNSAFASNGGRMSSGNKCPPAMYSKAKMMKMSVEISSNQNASKANVYEMRNWSAAVMQIETMKMPKVAASGGATKYFRCARINKETGTNATAV